jgi:hypothetical protein
VLTPDSVLQNTLVGGWGYCSVSNVALYLLVMTQRGRQAGSIDHSLTVHWSKKLDVIASLASVT